LFIEAVSFVVLVRESLEDTRNTGKIEVTYLHSFFAYGPAPSRWTFSDRSKAKVAQPVVEMR
jgi:hypothetical protein